MSNPQKDFLAHRRAQEANTVSKIEDDPNNPLHSVMTIEFNTTELCNRTCVFCPRVNPDIYPNRNLHFSKELASKVAKDLADFGFKGRISFSGFGEPILNKSFPDLIRAVREHLPDNWIDTNTNGDRLTAKMLHQLFDAGITTIYLNMYAGPEQPEPFEAVFKEAGIPED